MAASQLWLIQTADGSRPDRDWFRARGGEIIDRIPHHAWVVRWSSIPPARHEFSSAIRHAGPLPFEVRVAPSLIGSVDKHNRAVEIEAIGVPGRSHHELAQLAAKLVPGSSKIMSYPNGDRGIVRLTIGSGTVTDAARRLAATDQFYWIDEFAQPQLLNTYSVGPIQANRSSGGIPPVDTPIWDQGITGFGQIISIVDSGVDRNQDFFARLDQGSGPLEAYTDASFALPPTPGPVFSDHKIYGYFVAPGGASPYDRQGFHGTHVAGSAAGDAGVTASPNDAGYDNGDGMAPAAQILVQDIGDDETGALTGITNFELYEQSVRAGVLISSNSFGAPVVDDNGMINPDALVYANSDFTRDALTHRFEDLLILVAAGNDGGSGAGTVIHPALAKNVLTVGATEHGNDSSIAAFSSRGPAFDGRIKPDIVAPGAGIVSAQGDNNDETPQLSGNPAALSSPRSGTSFATPTVAGGAALARQYFMDGFYPSGVRNPDDAIIPSGAMLKSVLLNGTALTGIDFPDNSSGWGRIFLDNNLYFTGDSRGLRVFDVPNAAGLGTGEQHEFTVSVAAGQPLRATLTWYDPPGSLLSSGPALINDLDLEVVGGGQTYLGNRLVNGDSVVAGSPDRINNVEQVRLSSPMAATYTVRVLGNSVPGNGQATTDLQGFALSVSAARCETQVSGSTSITAQAVGDDIIVEIDPISGADDVEVYRALGNCSDDNPRRLVGTTDGQSFADSKTQGGFAYSYTVRGADACGVGPPSACVSAMSSAVCTLPPAFDSASVVANPIGGGECGSDLIWDPAQAQCPGADVRYNVYRSTDPFFEPAPGNLLATTTSTQFTDLSVTSNTAHYYIVRAEDTTTRGNGPGGGNELIQFATPVRAVSVGDATIPGDYVDDPDTTSLVALDAPWAVTRQDASTGLIGYKNSATLTYASNICASLTTPMLHIASGASELAYDTRFSLEEGWDGVVVEVSSDGGATWVDLPPDRGYPGDFGSTEVGGSPINACGFPADRGAFSGEQETFSRYSSDLSAYDGQSVMIRWRFSADPGVELDGFYLDNLVVSESSVPSACTVPSIFRDGFEN